MDRDEDDLFQHTSMTFGEHLEELRAALFKACTCLGIGFLIGLIFASKIVQLIQSPLEDALTAFYSEEAVEYLDKNLPPEIRSQLPAKLKDDPTVKQLVYAEGMVPQQVFFDPRDLLAKLKQRYPDQFSGIELPEHRAPAAGSAQMPAESSAEKDAPPRPWITKDDMISTLEWRKLSEDDRIKVESFNVQESFVIYIKAAFLAGALMSSPFVFYFLWSFVAAGLYPHEKKYVHRFLPVSVGLFLLGAGLAFLFVFPPVLQFFFSINKSMNQGIRPRISEWLSFVLLLPLGFGISFQLPLVMLFLERIGIFTVASYLSKWRIAVVIIAFAAMILSPGGDPTSMMMMFVPLVMLYFGGVALCKWLPSDRQSPTASTPAREFARVD